MADLTLKSDEDYMYIDLLGVPFKITGQGIGPDGDYSLPRGEDVAFLLELADERESTYGFLRDEKTTRTFTQYDINNFLIPRKELLSNLAKNNYLYPSNECNCFSVFDKTKNKIIKNPTVVTEAACSNPYYSKMFITGIPTVQNTLPYKDTRLLTAPYKIPRMDVIKGLYADMLQNDGLAFKKYVYPISQYWYIRTKRTTTNLTWNGADDYKANPGKQPTVDTDASASRNAGTRVFIKCDRTYYWTKSRCNYKDSDGSYQDYSNYNINTWKTYFAPNAENDLSFTVPSSFDGEITDMKCIAACYFRRESYVKENKTVTKNDINYTYAFLPISCKKDTTYTKGERWLFDFGAALDGYMEWAEEKAKVVGVDIDLATAAKPYFDKNPDKPAEGSSVTNTGTEKFGFYIYSILCYAKVKWHANLDTKEGA